MKYFIALFGFTFLLFSCGELEKPRDNKKNKEALLEIRKEPKIIEAFLDDSNILYVSVKDDGTRRDGYAQYICGILKEYNSSVAMVKVVKVNSMKDPNKDNAYGVLLGESYQLK